MSTASALVEAVFEEVEEVKFRVVPLPIDPEDEPPGGAHPFIGRIPLRKPLGPPVTGPHASYDDWGW